MKDLKNIKSMQELTDLRREMKHHLEIERLEFENSRLRLMQEFDSKRLIPNISDVVSSSLQKTILGQVFKLFK